MIKAKFSEYWEAERHKYLDNGGKLDFYLKFKDSFDREKYLSIIKLPKIRNPVARFRMSSHKLPVETGRYKGLIREDRIRPNCIWWCR